MHIGAQGMANDDKVLEAIGRMERREAASKAEADRLRPINKAVRKAVRRDGAGEQIGGTGFTVLKLSASPVARLLDRGRIGGEEFEAAQEITRVFESITGALMIRPQEMERRDKGYGVPDPPGLVDAKARYKRFADHWSARAKRGDPTLEILIAAVIDMRAFHTIEADKNIKHGKAETVTIRGLRDYAARARWVAGRTADVWINDASLSFRLRNLAGEGEKC